MLYACKQTIANKIDSFLSDVLLWDPPYNPPKPSPLRQLARAQCSGVLHRTNKSIIASPDHKAARQQAGQFSFALRRVQHGRVGR